MSTMVMTLARELPYNMKIISLPYWGRARRKRFGRRFPAQREQARHTGLPGGLNLADQGWPSMAPRGISVVSAPVFRVKANRARKQL